MMQVSFLVWVGVQLQTMPVEKIQKQASSSESSLSHYPICFEGFPPFCVMDYHRRLREGQPVAPATPKAETRGSRILHLGRPCVKQNPPASNLFLCG